MNEVNKLNNKKSNNSLNTVVKGTAIVFIGTIMGMLFAFIGRVLFARFFTPEQYGIFSLSVTILSVFTAIGTIGLQQGTTRQIAYYLGKGKNIETAFVIRWSLVFALPSGIVISTLIFILSDIIALNFFHMPGLILPLKLFSLAIPFFIFIQILSSTFRGFKKVKEKVYFVDFARNFLFPVFLIPVIILSLSFIWGLIVYVLSIVLTSVLFFIYYLRKKPTKKNFKTKSFNVKVGKELILFSLPLLLVMVMYQIMSWTDTIMLGFYKNSEIVGLYNTARPLGGFISTALTAMLFTYTPVVSELYAQQKNKEMKRDYAVLTKWVCSGTLPLVLIFVLFPETVINFLFGSDYILAATALQILSIGYFFNNLMGPNGATLTAFGKTRFLMYATAAAAIINIIMNAILIPIYGLNGAAIATIISLIAVNAIRSVKLYKLSKVHSLGKKIFKPIILSIVLILIIYFLTKNYLVVKIWMLPIIFILFIFLYFASLLLTHSIDEEDVSLLIDIENKTGLKLKRIKNILRKFI